MWPNSDLISLKTNLPSNHTRKSIPDSLAGTHATIEEMRKLVDIGKRDIRIRALAAKIIQNCREKDYYCYAESIYTWIRNNIKYAFDPVAVELLEHPWKVVELKIADCDSSSMLFASLTESIGLPARFACIKADANKPLEFTHVFPQVKIPRKGWITADCTMNRSFGWDPGESYERQTWPASHDAMEDHDGDAMSGLNDMKICCGSMDDICPSDYDSSLSGFGATDQQITEASISNVINGSAYNELSAARTRLGNMAGMLSNSKDALDKISDPQKNAITFDLWTKASGAYQRERASLDRAIAAYNKLASDIQTYSYGYYKPNSLGSFGIAPVTIAGIALAGGITIYLASSAFANAVGAWRGDANASKGLLTQLSDTLQSSGVAVTAVGDTTTKIGIVAAIGFAAYIGFQFLKKKGKI